MSKLIESMQFVIDSLKDLRRLGMTLNYKESDLLNQILTVALNRGDRGDFVLDYNFTEPTPKRIVLERLDRRLAEFNLPITRVIANERATGPHFDLTELRSDQYKDVVELKTWNSYEARVLVIGEDDSLYAMIAFPVYGNYKIFSLRGPQV